MYEQGTRFLPLPVMQKLADMAAFISKPATGKRLQPAHVKAQQAKARQLLQKMEKEQAYQQQLLQRRLDAVKQKYNQQLLLVELLDHLKQKPATPAAAKPDLVLLKQMQAKALKAIAANGLHEQAVLQAKILTNKHQQEQAILLKQLIFS
jgi:hypothetical protein